MSIRHRTGSDDLGASDADAQADNGGASPEIGGGERSPDNHRRFAGTHPSSARKRRRRHRSAQKGRRPRPLGAGPPADVASRERIFQDIEGLLRQIREQAEESADWSEEQLQDITQTVTGFTRSLEQEGDPISSRTQGEYQRIREKLSQALKG